MALAGCGARTGTIDDLFDATVGPRPQPEMCNGLDDDLNTIVDDGFRDELGRYVQLEHCGFCRQSCPASLPHALGVACELIEETPSCVAIRCADGFARSTTGQCIPAYERLCLGCADDGDCGDFPGARCADIGGERRCGIDCALGCPSGYACLPVVLPHLQTVPTAASRMEARGTQARDSTAARRRRYRSACRWAATAV